MPIAPTTYYPTIKQVTDLVRSMVQDDMAGATGAVGEGQIFVDDTTLSVTQSNFFNSGMRSVCRKLRTTAGPMLIYDNYQIIGVPALTSPTQGFAAPDPGVQVSIGFTGYFDGTSYNPAYVLPSNCLMVEAVRERVSGQNNQYLPMSQPAQGLGSYYQDVYNRFWEWRTDAIWMPGSLQTMDFQLRFQGQLATLYGEGIDTSATYIPINDSVEAVAGELIKLMAIRSGNISPVVLQWASDQVNDFVNEWIKRDQGMPYPIQSFDGGRGGNR